MKNFQYHYLKYFVFCTSCSFNRSFLPDLLVTLSVIILLYYCIKNNSFKLIFFSKDNFLYLFYLYLVLSSLLSEDILHSLTSSLPIIRLFFFIILINYLYEKKNFLMNFYIYYNCYYNCNIFRLLSILNNIDKENFSQITGIFLMKK